MAQRDRSQGFGFVYVDLAKLLAQRDELEKATPFPAVGTPALNFNKDPMFSKEPMLVAKTEQTTTERASDRAQTIRQIKDNLDRLQSLHHKLHAMLEELNQITDREKKKV
jgi:hypothetical protein